MKGDGGGKQERTSCCGGRGRGGGPGTKLTVQACCPFGGSCCRSWSRIIQWKNARTGKVMWVGSWCAVVERSLLEVFDAGDAKLEGKQSNPLERAPLGRSFWHPSFITTSARYGYHHFASTSDNFELSAMNNRDCVIRTCLARPLLPSL